MTLQLTTITRTSPFSGKTNSRDLPIDPETYRRWENKELAVQNAFPHLSASDREFILTGITDEEWEAIFGSDDID